MDKSRTQSHNNNNNKHRLRNVRCHCDLHSRSIWFLIRKGWMLSVPVMWRSGLGRRAVSRDWLALAPNATSSYEESRTVSSVVRQTPNRVCSSFVPTDRASASFFPSNFPLAFVRHQRAPTTSRKKGLSPGLANCPRNYCLSRAVRNHLHRHSGVATTRPEFVFTGTRQAKCALWCVLTRRMKPCHTMVVLIIAWFALLGECFLTLPVVVVVLNTEGRHDTDCGVRVNN